ncbi:DTW domain-containing protein 1 isoform X2 [Corvus moneduloides]|uniref:DTW domain-containing protein 1 isoform X2 n=1 Tax=Corvus moneduloides TaxID=1196302 RepID=UPI001363577C|nr:DTW domain-containing protein 1 isoform X2 [Corvus moneduloides]
MLEQHLQPGQGMPQKRSHVPFGERCKTSREAYSSTILPALAVHKYALKILRGAGKIRGGGRNLSFLEFSRESNKAAASHPNGFQAVPPHGGGSAGHGTQGRKQLPRAQLGAAGFSPPAQLPLKIDIIKHPNETDGKSTAVHAKLLAPDDVTIYKYPCIPEYEEKRHEIALIFPGPNSVSVKDIAFHLQKYTKKGVCATDDDCFREPLLKQAKIEPEEGKKPHQCISSSRSEGTRLKKIIFIDSTWNQTNKIITDERLQDFLNVREWELSC